MICTVLTERFGLRHPIVLAPMGNVAGGHLAATVSNAGGLGLVGGGYGNAAWLRSELSLVREETAMPWGVGLITWAATHETLELVLRYEPHAVMLSFGDPRPFAPAIKAAGCKLICQVQNVQMARTAMEAGADLIVAEGTEAGGHSGVRATLPLVPAVIDAVGPTPVIAAGGIGDGRGLAAALMLGAQGVLMGTRFYATVEALGHEKAKARIVAASADDTQRTRVFDTVRDYDWPQGFLGRALRNRFLERWGNREEALSQSLNRERDAYRTAVSDNDFDTAVVWAGEVTDLIDHVESASALVAKISADAESRLRSVNHLLR